jgi:glutamate--cysteine ligase
MSRSGVDREFERRLSALINSGQPQVLQGGRKGVEKESLRVTPDGDITTTPQPRALGSALTNEHITTDYSEALIELVTPPFTTSCGRPACRARCRAMPAFRLRSTAPQTSRA